MTEQRKQLGRGAFSVVSRPLISQQGQSSFVLKQPNPSLGQQHKKLVHQKYKKQKQLLDELHQKYPSKSYLFNQIYQITSKNQAKMKDLGDTNLSKIRHMSHYSYPFLEDFDNIIAQLIDAFIVMWRAGIVHKDIKPINIMAKYDPFTRHFTITFVDFTDSLRKDVIKDRSRFNFNGTTKYMSPEMLQRKYSQPRNESPGKWEEYVANDLWSLGMVLYFLVYNKTLVDMFKTMYFVKDKQAQQSPENKFLYEHLKEWPDIYQSLFPTENLHENQKKYVPMMKSLLSFDPNVRIRWLYNKIRQQQQSRTHQAVSRLQSTSQVLEQRQKKRIKKEQSSN